jgi:hypothetical protein
MPFKNSISVQIPTSWNSLFRWMMNPHLPHLTFSTRGDLAEWLECLTTHAMASRNIPEAEFINAQFCWGFLGKILRVLRDGVSVYNFNLTNQFQPTFARKKTLETFVPITSKNSASGFDFSILWHVKFWGVANEAVLNKVHEKTKAKRIPLFTFPALTKRSSDDYLCKVSHCFPLSWTRYDSEQRVWSAYSVAGCGAPPPPPPPKFRKERTTPRPLD